VSDANLILGRLNPDYFLGGEMRLDVSAAEEVMSNLSQKLNVDMYKAALSVVGIANNNMADAIGLVSLQRGVDPRECLLISFGGAGSLQASQLARISHIEKILVPAHFLGGFSAFGLLTANMRVDQVQTIQMRSDALDRERINRILKFLRKRSIDTIRLDGYVGDIRVLQQIRMRYLGQAYGLDVQIPVKDTLAEDDLEAICQSFNEAHKAQYGYAIEGEIIEFLDFKTTALGPTKPPALPKVKREKTNPKGYRKVLLDGENEFTECPIYERSRLGEGSYLDGPSIVEEEYSTTLLNRGDSMSVDEYGNMMIEVKK
jgi:N-methylhydantoinase A